MRRSRLVAWREVTENVRTKGFWIGLLAFPVILTATVGVMTWLETHKDARRYAVIDRAGGFLEALEAGIDPDDRARWVRVPLAGDDADPEAGAARRVGSGELFAFIVIEAGIETGVPCRFVSKNLTDRDLQKWFQEQLSEVVRERRLAGAGLDLARVKSLMEPVRFSNQHVSDTGAITAVSSQDTARQWMPVVFVYLLWIAVFFEIQMLLSNTIEEKSNRLIEVLLSSVSPLELMTGKIFGIALTGVIVLGAWVLYFLLAVKVAPLVLDFTIPVDLGSLVTDPLYLLSFLVYFVFGYLMLGALVAAIGSLCTSLKEAQNLFMPVVVVLMIPILCMEAIGKDPNGSFARALSFIPPFTPFVMMNRAAGPPPVWEYLVTGVIMVVATAGSFWIAAKVFRIGILMTGKPPRLREVLRWIRAPVTARN